MNTNTQHTPGPWRATCEGYIASTENGYVPIRTPFRKDAFDDGPNRSDHKEETLQANARLIAAAPAMLEALKNAVSYLEANRPKGKISEIFHQLNEYENGVLKPARAAIARAEGGAQG